MRGRPFRSFLDRFLHPVAERWRQWLSERGRSKKKWRQDVSRDVNTRDDSVSTVHEGSSERTYVEFSSLDGFVCFERWRRLWSLPGVASLPGALSPRPPNFNSCRSEDRIISSDTALAGGPTPAPPSAISQGRASWGNLQRSPVRQNGARLV